jgi:hypothetical protein
MAEDEKPWFECRAILELLGKPQEYIDDTAKKIVETIKASEKYKITSEYFSTTEQKEHLFSKFIEIELKVKDIPSIFDFCFDYMPSSIEIISPESFNVQGRQLTAFLSDLQARLHNSDMATKKMNSVVLYLRDNIYRLIKNMVTVLLRGHSLDIKELSVHSGIGENELKKFLDILVTEKYIKVTGDKYSLEKDVGTKK